MPGNRLDNPLEKSLGKGALPFVISAAGPITVLPAELSNRAGSAPRVPE